MLRCCRGEPVPQAGIQKRLAVRIEEVCRFWGMECWILVSEEVCCEDEERGLARDGVWIFGEIRGS